MANSLCGGDLSTLAGEINTFFKSVSRDLAPLAAGMVPLDCPTPACFIMSSETVCNLLSSININKAISLDCIASWILRDHALTLAHPISTIFHASIREGYLLTIWRSATVIPIPKVNPPRNISNDLIPNSSTAVLSKQLERIVGGWMLDSIIDRQDVNQYGRIRSLL